MRIQHPDRIWRFRLARDTGIPAAATYRLSEEFQVLQVHDSATWNELRASLHLQEVPTQLDFDSGIVVGLIASVGEPLASDWPLSVEYVTVRNGVGSLAARVQEGLYNPVRSAPYGVMAYFPGLQRLAIVRINRRVFYFE